MRSSVPEGRCTELTRTRALAALGLDVTYERGAGSALYERGQARPVWDFVGGYGACFFGHGHPALVEVATTFLQRGGVVQAQGSVRSAAAALSDRLAERLQQATGRNYDIVLANTGSEATELAARHAMIIHLRSRETALEWTRGGAPRDGPLVWTDRARACLAQLGLCDKIRSHVDVHEHNARTLQAPPVQLALQRSFHGCTARALDLTWDPLGRFGPRPAEAAVQFVDPTEQGALSEVLAQLTRPLLRAAPGAGGHDVELLPWTRAASFFVEPLQGEGGIHPLDPTIARAWQDACRSYGVPLVADEIQSGMGRTGSFLYAEQIGLAPDYILLGKSLGGGLAKISAVAIDSTRQAPWFALQYTSTFAEDDLSSLVALRALDLLDEENALARAAERGMRLQHVLQGVVKRYPAILGQVRGCGLMLGLDWRPREFERSAALRFLQRYGWLGYAMAGYLLREWNVRVAPALSHGTTMRLEPDYAIPDEAIVRLGSGIAALCSLLEREDAASILAPALGTAAPRTPLYGVRPAVRRAGSAASHIGFIGHFIDADGVALWDASFARLDTSARLSFLERIRPFAEPLVCHRDEVRSTTGAATTLSFIGIPVTSDQCFQALRSEQRHDMRDLVQRAIDMAADEGCSVVGLGGYCSILTRNGKAVRSHGMAITTGNGFTVGAALLALKSAASSTGVVWPLARAAVIGATGNIGAVVAALLAADVGGLTLLGRAGRADELYLEAGRILHRLLREAPDAPILRALHARGYDARDCSTPAQLAGILRAAREGMGDAAPILVDADLGMCRDAQIMVAASNEPAPILLPEHLSPTTNIIVDLAVPGDVHEAVLCERPRTVVLRGGVVRTPANPDWYVPGIPLQPGEMFACMAETVLMGLEQVGTHGSVGALTPDRVHQTLLLARRHGFIDVRTGTPAVAHHARLLA